MSHLQEICASPMLPAKVSTPLNAFKSELLFVWTSTTNPLLASSSFLLRQCTWTSCKLCTKLPNTLLTQENHLVRQFSIWYITWRRHVTLGSSSVQTRQRVLTATVMQTSLETGIVTLHTTIPVQPGLTVGGSFIMQAVQSFGHPSFSLKLLYLLLRQSTLQCPWHYPMYCLSCILSRKWRSMVF